MTEFAPTNWRQRIEPFTRPLFFAWSRASRGMTLGVRGVVRDGQQNLLLVRHTYLPGWWLPGGGVERGQTVQDAMIRELREEAGVVVTGPMRLISVHSNERWFRGDHVLIFAIDTYDRIERAADGEIAEIGWFALDALPADTNRGSRARLSEIFGATAADTNW